MYGVDESSNDLDRYFKILETEARELRECNPQSGSKPNFHKYRDSGNSGGVSGYHRGQGNGGDNYNNASNGYNSRPSNSYGHESNQNGPSSGGYQAPANSNYGSNQNTGSYDANKMDDWAAPPPPSAGNNMGNDARNNAQSNNNYGAPPTDYNDDQNKQATGTPQHQHGVSEDVDGYQRLDFNRCLISYNEPTSINIRHIFLNILSRTDLMEYTTKITDCASQDMMVLAIQRDNQLAESYASQLRSRGFWAFEVTNKTLDPVKLLNQHSVYRCVVTTMSYLRDNVDLFQFPSLVINFDHVVSHVKFLERFLNYRNPAPMDARDVYIYQMCFNHSTTSQNLKEFIQNQNESHAK